MSFDPREIEKTVAIIEKAFAGLSPPGDDEILHPQCRDDGDVVDFYGAPDWKSFSDPVLIRNYAAPCFFSAAAFRYYMPAFMIWSLEHPDTVEYLPESTIRAFNPDAGNDELRQFQISKFALFTDEQRRAVARFLGLFSSHPDLGPIAREALSANWE